MDNGNIGRVLAVAGTIFGMATLAQGQQLRAFYFEDWEIVDLGAPRDENDASELDTDGDGNPDFVTDQDGDGEIDVWAGVPGFTGIGWTVTTPATPGLPNQTNLGVEEWREWALTNANWWAFDVDNQRRGEFANGFAGGSTVAVADPDEWDDIEAPFTDPDTGIITQESPENLTFWNSTLTSPEITLPVSADEIVVDFSLSWRDEDAQEVLVVAQFTDGAGNAVGGPVTLLTGSSDSEDPNFFNDEPNAQFGQLVDANTYPGAFPSGDTLAVPVGATAVQLSFAVLNAGNDWWFAIDNIALFAESSGGPIIQPGNFVIQGQFLYQTVTPSFTLSRAIEADSYMVEISDTADFSNILATIPVTPSSPEDLTIPVTVPAGTVNTGQFYARASATNSLGTTGSINAVSFYVLNPVIGDLNGDGVRDDQDIADVNNDGFYNNTDINLFVNAFINATNP